MTVLFTMGVMTKTTRWLKQQKLIFWGLKIQDELSEFCFLLRPLSLVCNAHLPAVPSPGLCMVSLDRSKCPLLLRMHVCAKSLQSCWTLCTLWAVACQDPLSIGFSRQEFWSGWPFPPPGDLPNPQLKRISLMPYVISFLLCYWQEHFFHH